MIRSVKVLGTGLIKERSLYRICMPISSHKMEEISVTAQDIPVDAVNGADILPVADLTTNDTDTNYKIAYYDLETSGLIPYTAQVIQIAAMVEDDTYSCYILPHHIPSRVSQITGLSLRDGLLHLNGIQVDTVSREVGWKGLIEFFKKFQAKIVLVGHNVQFDIRMTMPEIKFLNLEKVFMDLDMSYVCTIPVIKRAYPSQPNYKLTTIADSLDAYDDDFEAHNAIGDVKILRNVMKKLNVADETLRESSKSLLVYFDNKRK